MRKSIRINFFLCTCVVFFTPRPFSYRCLKSKSVKLWEFPLANFWFDHFEAFVHICIFSFQHLPCFVFGENRSNQISVRANWLVLSRLLFLSLVHEFGTGGYPRISFLQFFVKDVANLTQKQDVFGANCLPVNRFRVRTRVSGGFLRSVSLKIRKEAVWG